MMSGFCLVRNTGNPYDKAAPTKATAAVARLLNLDEKDNDTYNDSCNDHLDNLDKI